MYVFFSIYLFNLMSIWCEKNEYRTSHFIDWMLTSSKRFLYASSKWLRICVFDFDEHWTWSRDNPLCWVCVYVHVGTIFATQCQSHANVKVLIFQKFNLVRCLILINFGEWRKIQNYMLNGFYTWNWVCDEHFVWNKCTL